MRQMQFTYKTAKYEIPVTVDHYHPEKSKAFCLAEGKKFYAGGSTRLGPEGTLDSAQGFSQVLTLGTLKINGSPSYGVTS